MAGEGLFFTGVVNKNNRDILKEEAAREALKIQKEQLEIQKENSAEARRKRREDGKAKAKDYSLENMDPFLAEQFQSQVDDYTGFVQENAFDIQDSNELTSQQSKLESDLAVTGNKYRSISTDLTALNNMAASEDSGNLKVAEDGTYLYQYNYNKIQEEVQSGNMTLDEALEAYPINAESMVNETEFVPFYEALIEADDADPQNKYEAGDWNYEGISKQQKADTTSKIQGSLKVNSYNSWDDMNAKRVYDTQQVVGPDGSRISGKEAFFLEVYENPDTGVVGGVTSPSQELMDQLDPSKGTPPFNKELSDQYADYLGQKIADEKYKNKGDRKTSKVAGETISEKKKRESEEAQEQYNVDTYNYLNESTPIDKHGVGVSQYESDANNVVNQSIDKNQPAVNVSVSDFHKSMSPEALLAFKERVMLNDTKGIEGKTAEEYLADNSNFTGIEAKLVEVGIDGNGNVIGVIRLGDGIDAPMAVIPWNQLSSAEHDTALKVEGVQQVINYRQPQTQSSQSDDNNNDRSSVL
jgi:hypothetical protein